MNLLHISMHLLSIQTYHANAAHYTGIYLDIYIQLIIEHSVWSMIIRIISFTILWYTLIITFVVYRKATDIWLQFNGFFYIRNIDCNLMTSFFKSNNHPCILTLKDHCSRGGNEHHKWISSHSGKEAMWCSFSETVFESWPPPEELSWLWSSAVWHR